MTHEIETNAPTTPDPPQQQLDPAMQVGANFLKLFAGAVIGFVFIIVVMVATAQQDVLTRMKAEGISLGYSTALRLNDDVLSKRPKLPGDRQAVRAKQKAFLAAQRSVDFTRRGQDAAWETFSTSVARLKRLGLCEVSDLGTDTLGGRVGIAAEVQQCQLDKGAARSAQRLLATAQVQAEGVISSAKAYFAALQLAESSKDELADAQQTLSEDSTFSDDELKVERSFGDMQVIFEPWVLFGDELVKFPPPLFQILLTFVSGLFGALLVTLILVVYPSNHVGQDDARPVTRTFLGGFIAVCVYIILLSGTAVLGSASTSTGAGTNYMAFCGIGILAGMYSDRVAGWLSDRADEFFKSKKAATTSGSGSGAGGGRGAKRTHDKSDKMS